MSFRIPDAERWVLESRRVVFPDGVRPARIEIDGERIAAVIEGAAKGADAAAGASPPPGLGPVDPPVVHVGDAVVMSGLVDCHVHINEPGRTEWEGFATATAAAAKGGVTSCVDMPLNCTPVTVDGPALAAKTEAAAGQLRVDMGFWGGVVPANAERLEALDELAAGGVLGCKCFLVHSGIDDFPDVGEADLRRTMPRLRDLGMPLLVHAELDLGPDPEASRHQRTHHASWLHGRPRRWEDEAIARMIRLCRDTGCAVHIVHLSSASALPMLARAKAEGLPISVETCPHYLCISAEEIPDGATHYKCAPPIREASNREALWGGVLDGTIDFVVTDHSPCTPGLKHLDDGDFEQAWGGIASLQLGLPNLWTEGRGRGLGLPDLSRLLSAAPARFAGLSDRKGGLQAGLDADLVIWRPDERFTVDESLPAFRHKVTPYLGRELVGRVEATLLRGRVIYDAEARPEFSEPPHGRFLLGRADGGARRS